MMAQAASYGREQDLYAPTSWWDSNETSTSTISYTVYNTSAATHTVVELPFERVFDKGKFFRFESSMEFRAWFGQPHFPKQKLKERHGFQQMARLPCYRGRRTR